MMEVEGKDVLAEEAVEEGDGSSLIIWRMEG